MGKVIPVGEEGQRAVIYQADPGMTREEIEREVQSLEKVPSSQDDEGVVINAREAIVAALELKEENEMAQQTGDLSKEDILDLVKQIRESEEESAKLKKLAKEHKDDEEGLIDSILHHWKWIGAGAAAVLAIWALKTYVFDGDDDAAAMAKCLIG